MVGGRGHRGRLRLTRLSGSILHTGKCSRGAQRVMVSRGSSEQNNQGQQTKQGCGTLGRPNLQRRTPYEGDSDIIQQIAPDRQDTRRHERGAPTVGAPASSTAPAILLGLPAARLPAGSAASSRP